MPEDTQKAGPLNDGNNKERKEELDDYEDALNETEVASPRASMPDSMSKHDVVEAKKTLEPEDANHDSIVRGNLITELVPKVANDGKMPLELNQVEPTKAGPLTLEGAPVRGTDQEGQGEQGTRINSATRVDKTTNFLKAKNTEDNINLGEQMSTDKLAQNPVEKQESRHSHSGQVAGDEKDGPNDARPPAAAADKSNASHTITLNSAAIPQPESDQSQKDKGVAQ